MSTSEPLPPIHQLSLSGGGFRAAFFHLGALHALAGRGRLRELQLLVTISGGSIAAGFFLQEWSKALRHGPLDDAALAGCALRAQQVMFRKTRNNPRLRAMASLRGLSCGLVRNEFGFSQAMARINRRWFGALLGESADGHWPATLPEWRIGCSDYALGRRCLVVVGSRGLPTDPRAGYLSLQQLPLARAIASSSAVPGVFEPIRCGPHSLGDGGVLDNHGLRELNPAIGHAVCVDASAPAFPVPLVDGWATPMRAMDLMMEQTLGDVLERHGCEMISLREPVAQPSGLDWWSHLLALRTDLDDFSATEAGLLFLAGHQRVAGSAEIPTDGPHDEMLALWESMSQAVAPDLPADERARLAAGQADCLEELERGRHLVFAGMQKRSARSVFVTLASLAMVAFWMVALPLFPGLTLIAALSWLPAPARVPSLEACAALAWMAGVVWLWPLRTARRDAMFYNVRQWSGILLGPVLLPALIVLSAVLRIKVLAFSTRDLTAWTRNALARRRRAVRGQRSRWP